MLGNGLEDVEDPADRRLVGHLVGNHQRAQKKLLRTLKEQGRHLINAQIVLETC